MNSSVTTTDVPLRRQRALASIALLLMVAVVVASAWLRLAQPRAACVDWPGCRAAMQPPLGIAADATLGSPTLMALVRGVHRLAASMLLLVAIVLAVTSRAKPTSGM